MREDIHIHRECRKVVACECMCFAAHPAKLLRTIIRDRNGAFYSVSDCRKLVQTPNGYLSTSFPNATMIGSEASQWVVVVRLRGTVYTIPDFCMWSY